MKYSYRFILLFPCLLLFNCSNPSNVSMQKADIVTKFGPCEISNLPDSFNEYVVKDSTGAIWYVKYGRMDNSMVEPYRLFPEPCLYFSQVKK